MKVSIVTTLYNHCPFLETNVAYMLKQSMGDFEWLIIDDCSTDGSYEHALELTKHDPRVRVIQNETNLGRGTIAIDRELHALNGDYFYRQDGDDFCAPDFLRVMVEVLDRDETLSMASARCLYVDENDRVWGRMRSKSYELSQLDFFYKLLGRNFLCAAGLLYRMSDIRKIGSLYQSDALRSGDWYLNLRMSMHGGLYYYGEALACYRQHGGNWSKIAFKHAEWEHVYGSSFLPVLLSFEDAKNTGVPLDAAVCREALYAAGRMCWMVCQKAKKAGVGVDMSAFKAGILEHCPDFDFSIDYTCPSWQQRATGLMEQFTKRSVCKVFPLTN